MKRAKAIAASMPKKVFPWTWLVVVLVLMLFAGIRIRLLDVPLERDEGEYAYAGQLILQGVPPYQLAYNMKLPGTYAAYAVIMAVFGETIRGIHLGLMLANVATSFLIFLLARKLFDAKTAVVSCASYALLSTSSSVLGLAAHANHFVVLCAAGGLLASLKARETGALWRFAGSGLLFGLAVLMKQQGIFFGAFACLWLLLTELQSKPLDGKKTCGRIGLFFAGIITPFLLTCLVLWASGVFDKFWFWTFSYAATYASSLPLEAVPVLLESALPTVLNGNEMLWALGALGLILVWFNPAKRPQAFWLTAFLLFSIGAVSPGFYFRQHYFILMLPALALLIGAAVRTGSDLIAKAKFEQPFLSFPAILFILAFGFTVLSQREMFFQLSPRDAAIFNYSENPFIESVEIARRIRESTKPDAKIVVIGSEPQIYFYAQRRSATGYIYTYPLMEEQPYASRMQQEMIQEIEAAQPEFLVFVGFPYSWSIRGQADQSIFRWYDAYQTNYTSVGIADFVSPEERHLRWGAENATEIQTKFFLQIWRRKAL